MNIIKWTLIIVTVPTVTSGAKILLLHLLTSTSHQLFLKPLLEGLAERGHNVTIVTNKQPSVTFTNVTARLPEPMKNVFQNINEWTFNIYKNQPDKVMLELGKLGYEGCRALICDPFVQKLIRDDEKYDLVFAAGLTDLCSLPLAYTFSENVIFLQVSIAFPPTTEKFDLIRPISYFPIPLSFMQSEMSIFERIQNVILSWTFSLNFQSDSIGNDVLSKHLPNALSIQQAYEKIPLVFLNQDPVITRTSPVMPHVIPIAGMHCRKPKPLSEELETIIDASGDNGIIYFSLGTVLQVDYVSNQLTNILVRVFSGLNQTIIWKSSHAFPGASNNIKFVSWIPQQDILGHPKTRLFITQGGMFSLQESVYHGVPVLGLPIFIDQFSNIKRMEELEIGLYLNVFDISEAELSSSVLRLLYNSNFSNNMKKYSKIFKDEMETPLERAIYWTEYSIKHNGENHFRTVTHNINILVYYSLDVLILIFTTVGFVAWIVILLTKKMKNIFKVSSRK